MRTTILLVIAITLSACSGGDSPTAPSRREINLSGGYGGQWASSQLGYGPARFNISHAGTVVSGTWSLTSTPDRVTVAGTISGTAVYVNELSMSLDLTLTNGDTRSCNFRFNGTGATSPRAVYGQIVTTNCSIAASGSVVLDTF